MPLTPEEQKELDALEADPEVIAATKGSVPDEKPKLTANFLRPARAPRPDYAPKGSPIKNIPDPDEVLGEPSLAERFMGPTDDRKEAAIAAFEKSPEYLNTRPLNQPLVDAINAGPIQRPTGRDEGAAEYAGRTAINTGVKLGQLPLRLLDGAVSFPYDATQKLVGAATDQSAANPNQSERSIAYNQGMKALGLVPRMVLPVIDEAQRINEMGIGEHIAQGGLVDAGVAAGTSILGAKGVREMTAPVRRLGGALAERALGPGPTPEAMADARSATPGQLVDSAHNEAPIPTDRLQTQVPDPTYGPQQSPPRPEPGLDLQSRLSSKTPEAVQQQLAERMNAAAGRNASAQSLVDRASALQPAQNLLDRAEAARSTRNTASQSIIDRALQEYYQRRAPGAAEPAGEPPAQQTAADPRDPRIADLEAKVEELKRSIRPPDAATPPPADPHISWEPDDEQPDTRSTTQTESRPPAGDKNLLDISTVFPLKNKGGAKLPFPKAPAKPGQSAGTPDYQAGAEAARRMSQGRDVRYPPTPSPQWLAGHEEEWGRIDQGGHGQAPRR